MSSTCQLASLSGVSVDVAGTTVRMSTQAIAFQTPKVSYLFIISAHQLLDNMDTSVDPCDDFYSFACGSFVNRTVIPDDKIAVSQRNIVRDELFLDMRRLIDTPVKPEDSPATAMLKKYFSSCMDEGECGRAGSRARKQYVTYQNGLGTVQDSGSSCLEYVHLDT